MSSFIYLSRSDLKVARSCATKLYYKKLGYPSANQDSNYTKMLRDGGFVIAKMAQLLYPDGIAIKCNDNLEAGIELTKQYLQQENVTLFEPVVYADRKLVRIDILVKQGDRIQIIDVKTKSFDGDENNELIKFKKLNIFRNKRDGQVSSAWRSTMEDVAYQAHVLEEMCSSLGIQAAIAPYLLLPDKAKTTSIDALSSYFHIRETDQIELASKFHNAEVEFTGNLAAFKEGHFLSLLDITTEVAEVMPDVLSDIELYAQSLKDDIAKISVPISKNCKNCEFRGNDLDPRDGFRECWGELAEVDPHILDLYQGGRIGGHSTPLINVLIEKGKVSLYDISVEALTDQSYRFRQLIQITHTQLDREWFSPDLPKILKSFKYPLYFIDFETSRMAIPYRAGMRPYELVAFQWSCHVITSPDKPPQHADWINIEDSFPNFRFAETLMEQIGDEGTILTWASHENSVLKEIYFQMEKYGYQNEQLKTWLEKNVKFTPKSKTRMVDMHALTLSHYFHPMMKGKSSLKTALPAVWSDRPYLHNLPWLKDYFKVKDGKVLSPYEVLENAEISEQTRVIKEGLEAMIAYQDIVYGKHKNEPEVKKQWLNLLKQYCCLDTMAMVIIWTHWNYLATQPDATVIRWEKTAS